MDWCNDNGIGSGTYYRLSDYEHENRQITFTDITGVSGDKVAINSDLFNEKEQKIYDYINKNVDINNVIARGLLNMSQSGIRKLLHDKNSAVPVVKGMQMNGRK